MKKGGEKNWREKKRREEKREERRGKKASPGIKPRTFRIVGQTIELSPQACVARR